MELREYLAIRRAYNLVRQDLPSEQRLTFVELAILCRMDVIGHAMNTSEIAEYQGALRPTMTHRTKHLAELGFMQRSKGSSDRRNVICEITDDGKEFVAGVIRRICDVLHAGTVLSRTAPKRIIRYVDAMGTFPCMSGDLVLLGIAQSAEAGCTVSELVATLGLLQPTVSMSVASLEGEGLVMRDHQNATSGRSVNIILTEQGSARTEALMEEISALVIRRKP